MIGFIEGQLIEALPTQVVIDVGGVGYEVWVPVSTYDRLPPVGERVRLLTHLVVREEEMSLYGFLTRPERDLFRLLVTHVSGVGPKVALHILSGMSPEQFRAAVHQGDVRALARLRGVGKKTAERVIVELRDKLRPSGRAATLPPLTPVAGGVRDPRFEEAAMALMALGFKQNEAMEMVTQAMQVVDAKAPVEEVVKAALKQSR